MDNYRNISPGSHPKVQLWCEPIYTITYSAIPMITNIKKQMLTLCRAQWSRPPLCKLGVHVALLSVDHLHIPVLLVLALVCTTGKKYFHSLILFVNKNRTIWSPVNLLKKASVLVISQLRKEVHESSSSLSNHIFLYIMFKKDSNFRHHLMSNTLVFQYNTRHFEPAIKCNVNNFQTHECQGHQWTAKWFLNGHGRDL